MKASIFFLLPALALGAEAILIEAEDLEIHGGWQLSGHPGAGRILDSTPAGATAPAAGAVRIPSAGTWRLWVRAKDFPGDRPGIRNFSVRVGGQRSKVLFGRHGRAGVQGWEWEDGGAFELAAGPLLLVVGESNTPFARCDALVLARDPYRPAGLPARLRIPAAEAARLERTAIGPGRHIGPPAVDGVEAAPAASLENESVRFTWHAARSDGARVLAERAWVRAGGGWKRVDAGAASYRVLHRPAAATPRSKRRW